VTRCVRISPCVAHPDAIQELAGHQNLTTTQRNMHLIPAALDDASRLLERPECINFVERLERRRVKIRSRTF